jgi:hypothetical protein
MAISKVKKVKTTDEVDFSAMFAAYSSQPEIPSTSSVVPGFENAEVVEYDKWPTIFNRTKKEFFLMCPFCYDCDGKVVELAKPDLKAKRQHYTCEMKDDQDKYRHPRIFITVKFMDAFLTKFSPTRLVTPKEGEGAEKKEGQTVESNAEFNKRACAYTAGLKHINWYCKNCMQILLDFSPRLNSQGNVSVWGGHYHYRCMCKTGQPKLIGIISKLNVFKNRLIPLEVQDFARQFENYPFRYKEDEPVEELQISSSYKPKLKRTLADLNTDAESTDHDYDDLVIDEDGK